MIISLPPISACPPCGRPAVRRPGKRLSRTIPAGPGPKAGRRKFPHRNDDSDGPHAAPGGGQTRSKYRFPIRQVQESGRLVRPRLSFGASCFHLPAGGPPPRPGWPVLPARPASAGSDGPSPGPTPYGPGPSGRGSGRTRHSRHTAHPSPSPPAGPPPSARQATLRPMHPYPRPRRAYGRLHPPDPSMQRPAGRRTRPARRTRPRRPARGRPEAEAGRAG